MSITYPFSLVDAVRGDTLLFLVRTDAKVGFVVLDLVYCCGGFDTIWMLRLMSFLLKKGCDCKKED